MARHNTEIKKVEVIDSQKNLKLKENMKYLYALMDEETRFWIAQQVADTKNTADVTSLLSKEKEVAGARSNTLISDGAQNFPTAFNKELWQTSGHVQGISITFDFTSSIRQVYKETISDLKIELVD